MLSARVWWWGRDNPEDEDSHWNRLVDATTKKPLTNCVRAASLLTEVEFKKGSRGRVPTENRTVAVLPGPLSSCSESSSVGSDSSDEPLVPKIPVKAKPFTSVNFFMAKLLGVPGQTKKWHALWDEATVLDAKFTVWLNNTKGLVDKRCTAVNAASFWSSLPSP